MQVCLGLDKLKDGCKHSITTDIILWEFEGRKYCMSIIDAPKQLYFHNHDYWHVLGCLAILIVGSGGELEANVFMTEQIMIMPFHLTCLMLDNYILVSTKWILPSLHAARKYMRKLLKLSEPTSRKLATNLIY